ncbi:predicted protein [Histoplasma capsulatum var. duboisii H88]|uniref:Predicted protein n=2 Tax=Ajellomyces capsulatus TaxID=5037 RepID=F0USR0_AJEC8|nr:predicted protein [Histoplasma capsulatum H143]EGC48937.1 predicted protein [Histoplasma capsulatum var. duboisii H88]
MTYHAPLSRATFPRQESAWNRNYRDSAVDTEGRSEYLVPYPFACRHLYMYITRYRRASSPVKLNYYLDLGEFITLLGWNARCLITFVQLCFAREISSRKNSQYHLRDLQGLEFWYLDAAIPTIRDRVLQVKGGPGAFHLVGSVCEA